MQRHTSKEESTHTGGSDIKAQAHLAKMILIPRAPKAIISEFIRATPPEPPWPTEDCNTGMQAHMQADTGIDTGSQSGTDTAETGGQHRFAARQHRQADRYRQAGMQTGRQAGRQHRHASMQAATGIQAASTDLQPCSTARQHRHASRRAGTGIQAATWCCGVEFIFRLPN